MNTNIKDDKGRITHYGFTCGYREYAEQDGTILDLWKECPSITSFHMRLYSAREGRIFWVTYPTLTEARKRFYAAARALNSGKSLTDICKAARLFEDPNYDLYFTAFRGIVFKFTVPRDEPPAGRAGSTVSAYCHTNAEFVSSASPEEIEQAEDNCRPATEGELLSYYIERNN